MIDITDYKEVRECSYKGEHYSVRDNGAVLRHSRPGKAKRALDDTWIWGKPGANGYLFVTGQVQVHRIVATAFHGGPPDKNMVVDHKDTNKQNNRPENLEWKTRDENVLNNPYTLAKLQYSYTEAFKYGKIDWDIVREQKQKQDMSWMRPVTQQEAQVFKENMDERLAREPGESKGKMGEWAFHQLTQKRTDIEPEQDLIDSLTPGAKQVRARCRTPAEFPCMPQENEEKTLGGYLEKLTHGAIFSKTNYGNSIVDKAAFTKDKSAIIVKTYNSSSENVKPGGHVSKITFDNAYFVHETIGSYFTSEGAEKYYTLEIGEEWTGGEVFDDYC